MEISLTEPSLVVLVGSTGSGKSTFAAQHFKPTEVISSDRCRGLITDDEADWSVNQDAFDILYLILEKRMAAGRLTVIDATSLRALDRQQLIDIAARHDVPAVAIAFNLPAQTCHERNRHKPDRNFEFSVAERHRLLLQESLDSLPDEDFDQVFVLSSEDQVNSAKIVRHPALTTEPAASI